MTETGREDESGTPAAPSPLTTVEVPTSRVVDNDQDDVITESSASNTVGQASWAPKYYYIEYLNNSCMYGADTLDYNSTP